jgi:phenylacetate-CoA ligase
VYRVMATSGSSGGKGLYTYDRAAWVELLAQFLRYSDWAGSRPRLPRLRVAAIGGGSPTHMTQRIAASTDVGVHRLLRLPVTLPLPRLVEQLNAFGPDFINVYPSMGALLAGEQLAGRLDLRLRGMSTSSEPLTREVRARLDRAFGVRPLNLYGTTEGLWGCECEAGSLHLFDDMCLVENVDATGRPAPDGERGERLLITNLFNRVQPLIRFELTDAVTVEPVREFQVVQNGECLRLRVALRPQANGASERLQASLVERLRDAGVRRPAVEVEMVERLERSPAGKLRMVIAEPWPRTTPGRLAP